MAYFGTKLGAVWHSHEGGNPGFLTYFGSVERLCSAWRGFAHASRFCASLDEVRSPTGNGFQSAKYFSWFPAYAGMTRSEPPFGGRIIMFVSGKTETTVFIQMYIIPIFSREPTNNFFNHGGGSSLLTQAF